MAKTTQEIDSKPKKKRLPPKKDIRKSTPLKKNPVGRPSEFDEAKDKIISFIRKGNTYECAAACSRVSYSSFNRWIKQGEEDAQNGVTGSKYWKFWKDVRQAEMEVEQEIVTMWRDCIPGNWQAGKEFLARKNPDKWGSREKVDVTSNGESLGKPVFLPLKNE